MDKIIVRLPNDQDQENICKRFAGLLRKDIKEIEIEIINNLPDLISSSTEWVGIKEFSDGALVIAKNNTRIRIFVTTPYLAEKLSRVLSNGIPESPLCFEVCLGKILYKGQNFTVHIGAFGVLCSKAAKALIKKEEND